MGTYRKDELVYIAVSRIQHHYKPDYGIITPCKICSLFPLQFGKVLFESIEQVQQQIGFHGTLATCKGNTCWYMACI